jgi:ubiquinone/menaquinone biosynthesis C-methylase UbiE
VLDVGAGSGDLLLALGRWGRRAGVELELVGVDVSPEIIGEARRFLGGTSVTMVEGDALSLPWRDRSFDVVCCCLALHHFPPQQAVQALREFVRVASRAVVVIDLERSYLAYAGTWLATHTVARTRLTRHDGPLSVLRAYTREELRAIAREAGIGPCSVRSHAFFRQVLIAEKEPVPDHA